MRISLDSAQDMKLLQHTDLSVLWSKEGDPGMSRCDPTFTSKPGWGLGFSTKPPKP